MRHDEQLLFEIEASRFLHHMVRMLVGTMVEVARGRFSQDDFLAMLERKDGAHQPKTAPACGLCLMEVKY
jgi:tRNA pseudouridine38-40 synthase